MNLNINPIWSVIWKMVLMIILISGNVWAADPAAENPLFVDPATQDYSENPSLLERIKSGPHGYFRFINIPFSNQVCQRFAVEIEAAPSLNLHGDAHIEQYAVTDLGRGLTDFDDSSTGPGILDLMRFGVSLQLTCVKLGWQEQADKLFEDFLRGYTDALADNQIEAPVPQIVTRIQAKFKSDRAAYFEWIDSIMEPMPEDEKQELRVAGDSYVEIMHAENPDLPHYYFDVNAMGYLRMGIGSAMDKKYLVRIQGMTEEPLDDVVLEVKEVRDLSGIDCIKVAQQVDAFRVLLGQARIAYQPFKHLGYFRFRGKTFWVHSWVDNYKEISIEKSFTEVEELGEVVYDVGVQLGLGHVKQIAAPFDLPLRLEQEQMIENDSAKLKETCKVMTQLTIAAWQQFCDRCAAMSE